MKKIYRDLKEAIQELRELSYSLDQSFGDNTIETPDDLREVWLLNMEYYDTKYPDTYYGNTTPGERWENRVNQWESTGNVYMTGNNLGFSWTFPNQYEEVEIELLHPQGWHRHSTLLSKAWLRGYRSDKLDFSYGLSDAHRMDRAIDLYNGLVGYANLYNIIEAIEDDNLSELLIDVADRMGQVRVAKPSLEDDDDDESEDLSDEELLGTSMRGKMSRVQVNEVDANSGDDTDDLLSPSAQEAMVWYKRKLSQSEGIENDE